MRIEVRSPQGKVLRHYSSNILLRAGQAAWTVPFAVSDPAGNYTITCRDVLTGQVLPLTYTQPSQRKRPADMLCS